MAAFQVPLNFSLTDWEAGTLDDMGQYTPENDTYQIGVMLLKFQGFGGIKQGICS